MPRGVVRRSASAAKKPEKWRRGMPVLAENRLFLTKPAQVHVFHNIFHICGNLGWETEGASLHSLKSLATVAQSSVPGGRSFDSPGSPDYYWSFLQRFRGNFDGQDAEQR